MKRLLLGAGLSVAMACGPSAPSEGEQSAIATSIRYVVDQRTGLCFAALVSYTYHSYRVVSITHVPADACERGRR